MEPAQTTNIVDVYVNYLRRKLHDPAPGKLIRTVRGQGYLVPTEGERGLEVVMVPSLTTDNPPLNPQPE
jgi:DNA-binding winged helix-turn-helix (wHTH) protein